MRSPHRSRSGRRTRGRTGTTSSIRPTATRIPGRRRPRSAADSKSPAFAPMPGSPIWRASVTAFGPGHSPALRRRRARQPGQRHRARSPGCRRDHCLELWAGRGLHHHRRRSPVARLEHHQRHRVRLYGEVWWTPRRACCRTGARLVGRSPDRRRRWRQDAAAVLRPGQHALPPGPPSRTTSTCSRPAGAVVPRWERELMLYYLPRAGENLSTAVVVAPVLEALVEATGASDVQFKGITFAYCHLARAERGRRLRRAASQCPTGPRRRTLSSRCQATSGSPTRTTCGSERNVLHAPRRRGRGLRWHQPEQHGGRERGDRRLGDRGPHRRRQAHELCPSWNSVLDNYIYRVAVEYHGGGRAVRRLRLPHEHFSTTRSPTSLTAASRWAGTLDGGAGDHTASSVSGNKIHHVMGVLEDGGDIYVLGVQSTSVMSTATGCPPIRASSAGSIYLDNSSSGWNVSNNVVTHVTNNGWIIDGGVVTQRITNWIDVQHQVGVPATNNSGANNYADSVRVRRERRRRRHDRAPPAPLLRPPPAGALATSRAPRVSRSPYQDILSSASPGAFEMDYGGAWGYVNSVLVPNPATGGASCPAGYAAQPLLGSSGVDWAVFYCSRPHRTGATIHGTISGGMWGYVDSAVVENPISGAASCPAGYTAEQTPRRHALTSIGRSTRVTRRTYRGRRRRTGSEACGATPEARATRAAAPACSSAAQPGERRSVLPARLCRRERAGRQRRTSPAPGTSAAISAAHFCWYVPPLGTRLPPGTTAAPGATSMVAPSSPIRPRGRRRARSGYTAQQVLGTYDVDWSVYFLLPATPGRCRSRSTISVACGGYVSSTLVDNPITGSATCPAGYVPQQLLGTYNVDWSLYACYQGHVAGAPSAQ